MKDKIAIVGHGSIGRTAFTEMDKLEKEKVDPFKNEISLPYSARHETPEIILPSRKYSKQYSKLKRNAKTIWRKGKKRII